MSAILKRVVPAATGATAVLRTRAPAMLSVRNYTEGATARDPGWSKKEKAVEDQYAHNREVEVIKKLKQEIEQKKKELEAAEKDLGNAGKKA